MDPPPPCPSPSAAISAAGQRSLRAGHPLGPRRPDEDDEHRKLVRERLPRARVRGLLIALRPTHLHHQRRAQPSSNRLLVARRSAPRWARVDRDHRALHRGRQPRPEAPRRPDLTSDTEGQPSAPVSSVLLPAPKTKAEPPCTLTNAGPSGVTSPMRSRPAGSPSLRDPAPTSSPGSTSTPRPSGSRPASEGKAAGETPGTMTLPTSKIGQRGAGNRSCSPAAVRRAPRRSRNGSIGSPMHAGLLRNRAKPWACWRASPYRQWSWRSSKPSMGGTASISASSTPRISEPCSDPMERGALAQTMEHLPNWASSQPQAPLASHMSRAASYPCLGSARVTSPDFCSENRLLRQSDGSIYRTPRRAARLGRSDRRRISQAASPGSVWAQPALLRTAGAGKTAFAKTLGAHLGFSVQFMGEVNDEHAEPS